MAKSITLFIISVLLLRVAVGRSLLSSISPESASHRPLSSSHMTASYEHSRLNDDDDDGACKVLELDKTECLVRKAMVAHTDYVYTQDLNGP